MPRNSFIQMTKLHNVRGRIYYISSPKKQENLYAVYETTERSFWSDLAKCNHAEFKKSGTEGKCIEARELIIALPESFTEYPPDKLLQIFTDHFRQTYGTDCIAALHHNKRKTNYHIHLIFSERTLLEQPIEKVATRNMFYDEKGNHVRTKKEILDEDGNIRKRCKVIHKGEVYERQIFSIKDKRFKAENFLDTVKQDYTNLINQYVQDEKQRLQVFERGGMYLATKKIGKNNPKAAEMEADNAKRTLWNQTVDRAIVTGVAKSEIMQIKKERITDRIAESVWIYGNSPNLLSSIIGTAIAVLELLISKVLLKTLELADKVISKELEAEPENTDFKEQKAVPEESRKQADTSVVKMTAYKPNNLTYEVKSSKGGVIVFSEIYYPGWSATVDGEPVELGRVDYILRALNVKPGNHKVVLDFHPQSLKNTETVAYVGYGVLVLLIIIGIGVEVKKRKKNTEVVKE